MGRVRDLTVHNLQNTEESGQKGIISELAVTAVDHGVDSQVVEMKFLVDTGVWKTIMNEVQ